MDKIGQLIYNAAYEKGYTNGANDERENILLFIEENQMITKQQSEHIKRMLNDKNFSEEVHETIVPNMLRNTKVGKLFEKEKEEAIAEKEVECALLDLELALLDIKKEKKEEDDDSLAIKSIQAEIAVMNATKDVERASLKLNKIKGR